MSCFSLFCTLHKLFLDVYSIFMFWKGEFRVTSLGSEFIRAKIHTCSDDQYFSGGRSRVLESNATDRAGKQIIHCTAEPVNFSFHLHCITYTCQHGGQYDNQKMNVLALANRFGSVKIFQACWTIKNGHFTAVEQISYTCSNNSFHSCFPFLIYGSRKNWNKSMA